jgi:SAM-dependent methyltransferase
MSEQASKFIGSIPELYDRYLGSVMFEPYAADLARRLATTRPSKVLEVACGTGILTRQLRRALPDAELVASDLNQPMIDYARAKLGDGERIAWRQVDAASLPFDSHRFDAIACQFGVMFVPDKEAAFREARRVLSPGGTFGFNVWDAFVHNPFGRIANDVIASCFPDDPPTFYRVPFGFHEHAVIEEMLVATGFVEVRAESVPLENRSSSARDFAIGLVKGNPVRLAIEERGGDLEAVVAKLESALAREGGAAPYRSTMRATVVTARAA